MLFLIVMLTSLFGPPLLFCGWMIWNRATSRAHWLAIVWLAFCSILQLVAMDIDLTLKGFEPFIFVVVFLGTLTFAIKKNWAQLPTETSFRWRRLTWITVIVIFATQKLLPIPSLLTVREYPQNEAVSLEFPLKGEEVRVINGGSSVLRNHHFDVLAQKYALDLSIIKNEDSSSVFLSDKNADYYIYDKTLYSPCAGEVVAALDSLPDRPPLWLGMDFKSPAGNYVAIFCQNVTVLMAHLQPQSLKVKVGDFVTPGQEVGRVGNSGNTTEPHLHIQAVQGRDTQYLKLLATARGVPMLFQNRYLVRDDVIKTD